MTGFEFFKPRRFFGEQNGYTLLPFRFLRLDTGRSVVTNLAGQHLVIPSSRIEKLVARQILPDDPLLEDLEAAHIVSRGSIDTHVELLAAQIRTRHSRLPDLAALHMFVVTLRCNHSCGYCQVSRVSEDRAAYDMSPETADKAVDLMLSGPARQLKVEFQGGESLLNFPLIQRIVRRTKDRAERREVGFVIATNLTLITDEMLEFCAEHNVSISTSIDGPSALHNRNRPCSGLDSHARTVAAIDRCRARLGADSVNALMTCSAASLEQPEAIIDEYRALSFHEVFLRELSPYGFAARSASSLGYRTDQFLKFYERGLRYILDLNRQGIDFREVLASIVLTRMLTSTSTGYVDLQSPTGAAFGALVYNYDGSVYASDEGRMLAEMGDQTFRLGNVHAHTFEQIYSESPIIDIAYRTMTEGQPGCSECAFQSWCGSDPVRHHAVQGDVLGHRPTSDFCRKHMGVMKLLVRILEDEPDNARILRSWAK